MFFWRRRKRPWDPFSPLRFFTACWFGAIGLTQLRLLPDHPEWSAATWCAIFLGIGSFWFGGLTALFASRACVAHADAPVGQNSVELKPQLWRQWDRYPLVPILRGLIVLSIGVLLLEFYLNGIPILDPTLEVRMTVGINSYVHKISLALIPYSIAYGVFLLQQREARNRVVVADVAVIMLALAMIVALDSRFFLANVFVVWVVSYHYLRRSLSRRAFVVFAIVHGQFLSVPFLLMFQGGFLYVCLSSFGSRWSRINFGGSRSSAAIPA